MITWVLYLCIGIVVGGMAGFYFAKLDDFSKKQKQELEDKLQKSEREFVEYKDQVTDHFRETANLINSMTESYQKVHEHLARGSIQLCNNSIEVNKLTVSSEQLLPSASDSSLNDADSVTSLADSEAPKDSKSDNNNNKSERHIDSAPAESIPSPPSNLSTSSTSSTAAQSDEPLENVDLPNIDHRNKNTTPEKVEPSGPVLETMAVAEDEEPAPKPRSTGNRTVH